MVRILLATVTVFFYITAIAQSNSTNLERLIAEANNAFENGDYKHSKTIYSDIYLEYGSKEAITKIDLCNQCIDSLSSALQYEREDNFNQAIDCYQSILVINPKDPNVPELIITCRQKLYAPLINQAKQLYREGKYIEARDKLREYMSISGQTDEELLSSITECITWTNEAKLAFDNQNYNRASEYYNRILQLNPTDVVSARALAEINRLSQTTKILYVEKTKTRKSIIPEKNCFNFRLLSGFDKPTVFGAYIGYNYKIFQIGVDFAIGKSCNITDGLIENDDFTKLEGNAIMISEDRQYCGSPFPTSDNVFYGFEYKFFSPKFQFAISPGLNFKYFSIECGLGTMLGTEYTSFVLDAYLKDDGAIQSLAYKHYLNNKRDSSYFLIRPMVTGFIPASNRHKGFSVSFGYNFVSGASSVNNVVFGIGFFF